jgi:hypothetical protein
MAAACTGVWSFFGPHLSTTVQNLALLLEQSGGCKEGVVGPLGGRACSSVVFLLRSHSEHQLHGGHLQMGGVGACGVEGGHAPCHGPTDVKPVVRSFVLYVCSLVRWWLVVCEGRRES